MIKTIIVFRIIFSSNCLDYENFCYIHNLDTLEARRTELCRSFFASNVLNENSCLHYTYYPHREWMLLIHFGARKN